MSAEDDTRQRSMPLRDLISRFDRGEQRLKLDNEKDHSLNPYDAVSSEKKAREAYVKLATAIAEHLLIRLLRSSEDSEDRQQGDVIESSPAGLHYECIQADEILADNFVVVIRNENREETIWGEVAKVEFMPSLHNKRGIKFDEKVPDEYLQRLGRLFYELFSAGSKSFQPGRNNTEVPSSDELSSVSYQKSALDGQVELEDEEEPGSEKGRRRSSINETNKLLRKMGLSDVEDELHQKCVPMSICRLVADLIHADDTFECLNDVKSELSEIIDRPNNFLFNGDDVQAGLHFREDILYGRGDALSSLFRVARLVHMDAFVQEESRSRGNDLILIQGEPGSGKSHLMRRVGKGLVESGWSILRCKFDCLAQNRPLSTFSSAFENFFHRIATLQSRVVGGEHGDDDNDDDDDEEGVFRNALLSSVRRQLSVSGIVILGELIPSFRALYPDIFRMVVMDDDSASDESNDDNDECKTKNNEHLDESIVNDVDDDDDDDDAFLNGNIFINRLHYFFWRLIRAISRPDRPVLFFLDDLQWADIASLNLFSSLVTDFDHTQQIGNADENDSHSFLTVGSYRSNEVDNTHILANCFTAFDNSNAVRVTNISLDGITKTETNAMVSDALKLPTRLTRALTHVVHTKTLGNPLFVKSFMTSLVDDKLLYYSLVKKRWVWDIETVKSLPMDESVALIMTRKLARMPHDVQYALIVASCFGFQSNEEIFKMLSGSDQFTSLIPWLQHATQEGVLEKCGPCYAFPHDTIQQAVYELIPSEKMDEVHYNIGLQLMSSVPDMFHLNPFTFLAISQINRIRDIGVTSPFLHNAFATLNLKAGEHSIEVADFSSALSYVEHGLIFLGNDGWDSNYKLCLRLHDAACAACYLNALPNRVSIFSDEIMKKTRIFEERIKSYYILTRTLATTGALEDAIQKAFQVLSELGEDFPSDITSSINASVLMSTNELLGNYSKKELLNFPKMIDERKQWAMKFLHLLFPYISMVSPKHIPLVLCRMVMLSIQHGFCRETAFGLHAYAGHIFMSNLNNIDEGYQFAKMSPLVLERFSARALYPKLQCLHNFFIAFWVEPIQSTASVLAQSHQDALMVGDIEYAALSDSFYCIQSGMCGCQLDVLDKECARATIEMVQRKQIHIVVSLVSVHKVVLELKGSKANPFEDANLPVKNEDELLRRSEACGRSALADIIYFNRMFVAFFFKKYDAAAEFAKKLCDSKKKTINRLRRFLDIFHIFYQGLVAFHFSRSKADETEWMLLGEESVVTFQSWAKHSVWNFENKLLLLQAECHFSKGNNAAAEGKYKAAIESARKHRFLHEEGLAMDLLGMFYKSCGKVKEEAETMKSARGCYNKWGAHRLLEP